MKTNKPKHHKPFHLHVEHFFRRRYILMGMLGLLGMALVKVDHRIVHEAYLHGYGMVGQYMREETSRVPVTFEIAARAATHSGR